MSGCLPEVPRNPAVVSVGAEHHVIDARPVTVVCTAPGLLDEIEYPGRAVIDLEAALYHGERVQTWHESTERLVRFVFQAAYADPATPCTPETIRHATLAVRHFAGRIDLTLKLMDMGRPVVWKYPEAGMHPAAQAQLGDVAIELSRRAGGNS